MIYHITARADWETALKAGVYRADSLEREGFIHCSARHQVLSSAGRYFRGQRGLLLLEIDPHKTSSEIRYENLEGAAEDFPHIYGPLDLAAVVRVLPFEPAADGSFSLPPADPPAASQ
jgi:uncharacterized protein (DUF952 family)